VWTIFPSTSTYFTPSSAPFMINYRVTDLAAVLAALQAEGCAVDDRVEESEFGRFGWVQDPEGNRVELWEPPAGRFPGQDQGTRAACFRPSRRASGRPWPVDSGP